MRKLLLFLILTAMISGLTACEKEQQETDIHDVDVYSDTPETGIPYVDETVYSTTIPDHLLSVEQAKSLFEALGFTEYQEITDADTSDTIIFVSESGNKSLEIESSEGLIVATARMCVDVDKADISQAVEEVVSFIRAVDDDPTDEEQENLRQTIIEMFEQVPEHGFNDAQFYTVDAEFFFIFDEEEQKLIVNW